jgi:hypothetical protein
LQAHHTEKVYTDCVGKQAKPTSSKIKLLVIIKKMLSA